MALQALKGLKLLGQPALKKSVFLQKRDEAEPE
jgi:hypothetical protein